MVRKQMFSCQSENKNRFFLSAGHSNSHRLIFSVVVSLFFSCACFHFSHSGHISSGLLFPSDMATHPEFLQKPVRSRLSQTIVAHLNSRKQPEARFPFRDVPPVS